MPNRRPLAIILLAATLLAASCRQPSPKAYDPRQVAFSAAYNPLFDGQLYTSMILALGNSSIKDRYPMFTVSLTSPADGAVLRVVVDSSALNYVTTVQEVLPRRGAAYSFQPAVKWKYGALRAMRTPGSVDLTFPLYINDEQVDVKNLRLGYRPVGECPLSLVHDGHTTDFRWLFAAYVNEEHPQIEQILTDIMEQATVSRISGYQGSADDVRAQVFAVWYYALARGITYSSITCTSNPSTRANVQHIRLFDEVWATRQANCVDACVFFASILRRMGLKPVIFVEPCHAYLGYYTDKNRRDLQLLETTITSWVNFPQLERTLDSEGRLPEASWSKVRRYLSAADAAAYEEGRIGFEEVKRAVAASLFEKASEYDRETYQANRANFADTTVINYQQLDIEQLRTLVQPIN